MIEEINSKLNFKNIFIGVVLTFCFSINLNAFSEGIDYIKLENPIPNSENSLIKIFSYDCPYCYKYDKLVTPIVVKNLKYNAKFTPFHLKTKAKYGKAASEIFAVLIIEDIKNGVSLTDDSSLFKMAKMAYYNYYHDKKLNWNDEMSFLQTGLNATDLSLGEFENLLKDQKVQNLLKEWDLGYDIARLQGVPAFVVNGKYLINISNISSIDSLNELIDELLLK